MARRCSDARRLRFTDADARRDIATVSGRTRARRGAGAAHARARSVVTRVADGIDRARSANRRRQRSRRERGHPRRAIVARRVCRCSRDGDDRSSVERVASRRPIELHDPEHPPWIDGRRALHGGVRFGTTTTGRRDHGPRARAWFSVRLHCGRSMERRSDTANASHRRRRNAPRDGSTSVRSVHPRWPLIDRTLTERSPTIGAFESRARTSNPRPSRESLRFDRWRTSSESSGLRSAARGSRRDR